MSANVDTRYDFSKLAKLVEEIQSENKTGQLVCQRGDQQAKIYYETGQIIHAVSGTLIGERVLYSLAGWTSGLIYFEEKKAGADYDIGRTIDNQQALLFTQTINLLQTSQDNNPVELNRNNGTTNNNQKEAMFVEFDIFENEQDKTQHKFWERQAQPAIKQTAITLPPGQVFRNPYKLQATNPIRLFWQLSNEKHNGYLGCNLKLNDQEETAIVVMERGSITTVRYNTKSQTLNGQLALDALLEACEKADLTVTAVECELKVLKAYQTVLANHVMQPNLTTTITTIIQTVRDIVQNRLTAALRLSSPARNLFYLLSEGEALGCYEAKNGILELVDIPFSGLVEEKGVRLDVLGRPASEPLNLPRPARKPVTLDDIFNAANETVVEPPTPEQHQTPVSKILETDWIAILEQGRRPYSNLAATTQNFNGLKRTFEKSGYTGLIELKSSDQRLHFLIEKGVPVRECVLDPIGGRDVPNNFSVFEALDRPGFIINVYLEQKKVSPEQFSAEYLQTLVDGSFSRAVKVVQEALRAGLTPEIIYDAIFASSMRQIGVLWQTGKVSIAQEHLATGMTEYCRNMVMSSKGGIPSKRVGRVLLTSVSGNNHTLGLNLLGDVFRWQGWEVFPLFSEMPENEITEAVYRHQIDLICLSVSLPGQTIRAIKTVKTLRQSGWKGLIEVGGAAFINNPEAFKQTGADFLGGDAQATVEYATRLILERDKALNPD